MFLDKDLIFTEEVMERMAGTQGHIIIDEDGNGWTVEQNITDPSFIASTPYDCSECEDMDEISIDYIDSLFDLLLEQIQN